MIAADMERGCQYRILQSSSPDVVEFERTSSTGNLQIVHPRGELDTQSSCGIGFDVEVEEVSDLSTDGKCPGCQAKLPPDQTVNEENPACRKYNAHCSCGWMGRWERTQVESSAKCFAIAGPDGVPMAFGASENAAWGEAKCRTKKKPDVLRTLGYHMVRGTWVMYPTVKEDEMTARALLETDTHSSSDSSPSEVLG